MPLQWSPRSGQQVAPWEFGSVSAECSARTHNLAIQRSTARGGNNNKDPWLPAPQRGFTRPEEGRKQKEQRGAWDGLNEDGVRRVTAMIDEADATADQLDRKACFANSTMTSLNLNPKVSTVSWKVHRLSAALGELCAVSSAQMVSTPLPVFSIS